MIEPRAPASRTTADSRLVTEVLPAIVEVCKKDAGAHLIDDDDPQRLVSRLIPYYIDVHSRCPSCFGAGERQAI